ncbi:MAG TPA: enoyl-CoA hydratase/isomerase family protein [Steroidobacteraceae bacterium]|nr:enoyl-CoA hydratase/isomerase family protein [Steroidobacteraceae bacterium]
MTIELTQRGGIATVTLARPPVNAIGDVMIADFHATLDALARREDWQVLHIRSAQKVFAAGADLALIRSWKDAASPTTALRGYIERLQGLYRRIEELPQVSVCEIGGAAMGGGYELALSCDLRIAAEEAKIALPEVGIGLLPGAGGTQRLTRLCGRGVAARIILSGEPVDGRLAHSLGMVDWAFPRATLEEEARSIVERIAHLPVHAQSAAKRCIAAAFDAPDTGFAMERDLGGALLESARTQALISAFLERNSARS